MTFPGRQKKRGRVLIITALLVFCAAAVSFFFIDLPMALFLFTLEESWFKRIFNMITKCGRSELYLVPTALCYIFWRFRKQLEPARRSLYIFTTVAVSGLTIDLIKIIFGRFRPDMYRYKGMYGFEFFKLDSDFLSFPSGHATTVTSFAIALCLLFPRFRPLWLTYAFVISISRIIVSAHYFSDVLIGAFIGACIAIYLHEYFFCAAPATGTPGQANNPVFTKEPAKSVLVNQ